VSSQLNIDSQFARRWDSECERIFNREITGQAEYGDFAGKSMDNTHMIFGMLFLTEIGFKSSKTMFCKQP
jgi:hypothetical protein